ncbi:hypothetical protein AB0I30_18095 [Nocardia tengchongensis]|uniref:hypothetical protein n=1 Tax=Nocardia tengchongensis TaxID=2055889 RepID=UPI0033FF7E44
MTEDDSARREFVFGLLLATIATGLFAGLTALAAVLGSVLASDGLARILAARHTKPTTPESSPRPTTPRAHRHTNHRHSRRALSTRRPGGVLH